MIDKQTIRGQMLQKCIILCRWFAPLARKLSKDFLVCVIVATSFRYRVLKRNLFFLQRKVRCIQPFLSQLYALIYFSFFFYFLFLILIYSHVLICFPFPLFTTFFFPYMHTLSHTHTHTHFYLQIHTHSHLCPHEHPCRKSF